MPDYVLTTGFQKKTLAEIKLELDADFQTIFGSNIDLDTESNFGQIIGKLSLDYANLWDALEEIYISRDPGQAIGTSLDNIMAENAIQRIAASATQVLDVILQGTDGTVVNAGKKARQPDVSSAIEYELDTTVTIDKAAAREGIITVTSVAVGNYTVTIDSIPYTYSYPGGGDELTILNGIKVLIDAGAWTGTTTVDATNQELELQLLTFDFAFSITGNLQIDQVGSAGDFTATETGANTLPANSLTEIVTPVTGWTGLYNPGAGITGNDLETDSAARIRREQSISGIGAATEISIRSSLLNDVEGITGVAIYSNRTDTTDDEGRPPHSFECVIIGGDDDEIANKIWEKMPAGILSYGNTTVYITDSQGYTQSIRFSRAINSYIWVKVKRDLYDEEAYPENGDTLIKDNIVAWSLITNNINVGKDVIRQRLNIPVYEVSGIEDIEITIAVTDTPGGTPSYSSNNIIISDRNIAVFAVGRIIVEDLTP